MVLFFVIFFSIYAAANYYIFIRGWQALSAVPGLRIFYLIIFLVFALAYIASRIFVSFLPPFVYDALLWTGSLWFAFMLYFFLFIVLADLIRLFNSWFNFFPAYVVSNYPQVKLASFITAVLAASIVILIGYLNTRNVVVNSYTIEIPRKSAQLHELNAVLVADFHLTPINDGKLLKNIVAKINDLNPDIVFMPGDVVDDKAHILRSRNIGPELKNIKSKYGVFVSNGNHEFITGVDESDSYLREFNLHVLRDSVQLVAGSFYVAGREDISMHNFTGKERKDISAVLINADRSFPLIVLDHTPSKLYEVTEANAELQLSGHTHHGQLFPANLITKMVYEVSWGYLKKGYTQFYVTCGVGTWGPPVRLGSDSEIVNLKIKFVD